MPRPANGRYRLAWQTPGGSPSQVTIDVTDAGVVMPFGTLAWEPAGDCFRLGLIALKCLGGGEFIGINDNLVPPGSYTGTCVLLP